MYIVDRKNSIWESINVNDCIKYLYLKIGDRFLLWGRGGGWLEKWVEELVLVSLFKS